jgi:hypothetical protein
MTPERALLDSLCRAETALAAGDAEAANAAMAEGADLCRRLHAAGIHLPAAEAEHLRATAERCGAALVAFGKRLNDESFRDDNHRRGILSYQDGTSGGAPRHPARSRG